MDFLILESWESSKNRRRRYAIQISGQGTDWRIHTRWGRIGKSLQHKIEQVDDEKKMRRRVQSIVRARLRHRYYLCERSAAFPDVPALGLLEVEELRVGKQMKLF